MALYKISSSRVNNIEADQYAGSVVEEGLIWYDPNTGVLRLYNGLPGGQLIGGSGTSSEIVNGTSNVRVYPNGPVTVSVNGVANVAVFEGPRAEFDAVRSAGNISTDAYFIGDGSRLTGLPANYGNANVAAYLPTYTGAVTANTVTATGNISGNYFVGNGSLLTGISSSSDYSNANVAAYLPTYTGNLISLQGNVTTTGNVQGSYIIGDGSLLTGITASLPDQTGQQGKYLSTNGSVPSWQTVAGVFGLTIDGGDADFASTDLVIDAGGA